MDKLDHAGYGHAELSELQKLGGAKRSDLLDVLEYISSNTQHMSTEVRVSQSKD